MSNKVEIARLAVDELSRKERLELLARLQPGTRPSAATDERIVRRREVASKFSVSVRAVDNWARQGLIQRVRLKGRVRGCGFRLSDVERMIGGVS